MAQIQISDTQSLDPICGKFDNLVFGLWARPYGANGQMSMTVHNYRPRQFHRTSNRENPSSRYRIMGSAILAAARPPARPDRDDNTPQAQRAEG